VRDAPDQIGATVDALLSGDVETAQRCVTAIDRTALWVSWFAAGMEWAQRHVSGVHTGGIREAAAPTKATVRAVFERDSWTCRYCDLRVVDPTVLRQIGRLMPAEFPWTYRNADSHPAALVLAATPDHVVPLSIGGDSTPGNLVTACGVCQYNKGSCTLEELELADPRGQAQVENGWSGLTARAGELSRLVPGPGHGSTGATSVDFELEYLVAYGRVTGQLPAMKHKPLVEKVVRVLEAAIAVAHP
jgi:hypothetical protein